MLNIAEQIQDNAVTKLRLTSADDEVIDNVKQVIDAVKSNSSIVSVEFVEDFLGCVRHDSRSELVQALCYIPSLQEVYFEDGFVMIANIAELLCECKGLKVLSLKQIILQGVQEEFDAAEMALYQHQTLKEFTLEDCRPAIPDISLDALAIPNDGSRGASGSIATLTSSPSCSC